MVVRPYRDVAGFILAGGASSRMGVDKGLLDFDGVPLLLHTARLLKPLVTEVMIVGSPQRYAELGLRVIPDNFREPSSDARASQRGSGPLAGISAALGATRSPWNLILACDMPYLSPEWLNWFLSRAVRSSAEGVVPQTARGLEPLAAVYRRECGTTLAASLASGMRKVTDAIQGLLLEIVSPRDWQAIDPARLVLTNMNAPEDYKEALKWRAARSLPGEVVQKSQRLRNRRQAPKRKRLTAPHRRK
jgi:molybdenum cofactor guanylyltransferase